MNNNSNTPMSDNVEKELDKIMSEYPWLQDSHVLFRQIIFDIVEYIESYEYGIADIEDLGVTLKQAKDVLIDFFVYTRTKHDRNDPELRQYYFEGIRDRNENK